MNDQPFFAPFDLVIEPIPNITIEHTVTFLQRWGYYDAKKVGDNIIITSENLKRAQLLEEDIRQKLSCKVYDNHGNWTVKCQAFKTSGKWYSEYNIPIPWETPDREVRIAVRKWRDEDYGLAELFFVGFLSNGVPFLVPLSIVGQKLLN